MVRPLTKFEHEPLVSAEERVRVRDVRHGDGPGYRQGQHWQLPILQGISRSVGRVACIRATPLFCREQRGSASHVLCIFAGLVPRRPMPCSRADRFLPTIRVIKSEKWPSRRKEANHPPHTPSHTCTSSGERNTGSNWLSGRKETNHSPHTSPPTPARPEVSGTPGQTGPAGGSPGAGADAAELSCPGPALTCSSTASP